jgi:uncharacterized protein YjiK
MKLFGLVLVIVSIGGYLIFGSTKELDDVAAHAPYKSKLVLPQKRIRMPENYLASGITFDWDSNQYVMLSDHPHTLFSEKISTLKVVDESMKKVVQTAPVPSDSDIEGVAYVGSGVINAISESGMLYVVAKSQGDWALKETKQGLSGIAKKVSSLAFDTDNRHLYTAEKEGEKILYKLDLEGKIMDSVILTLPEGSQNASLHRDFTISGLAYDDGKVLIISEAYSTIFVYSLADNKIVHSIGLNKTHEVSGITINANKIITLGDFEDYLPEPVFSQFEKQEIL